jgi:hypothetical protein
MQNYQSYISTFHAALARMEYCRADEASKGILLTPLELNR